MIDFGGLGVGDPSCDLVIAWTFFSVPGRAAFRSTIAADDAMWARARGWALWKALIILSDIIEATGPQKALAQRVTEAVLAEHRAS